MLDNPPLVKTVIGAKNNHYLEHPKSNSNNAIRSVKESDREWIKSLMSGSLGLYYDGDHDAHASRIIDTSLNDKGKDHFGFFSTEQRIFIYEIDNKPVGLINLVGKKQGTYKISPLIVDPKCRKHGIGSKLLTFAENYAITQKARQLYCTVAKENTPAINFFQKKGFIVAGRSQNRYKVGITEMFFYKPLKLNESKSPNISVSLLNENDEQIKRVRKFIMEQKQKLQDSFNIDDDKWDAWVDSIFGAYSRRTSKDVNRKYKLICVATDKNTKEISGLAVASPKKGNPIKIMPFLAVNEKIFELLLQTLPQLLQSENSHMLYLHINPNSKEAETLQKCGWVLEALMPHGYKLNVTTQQWSCDLKKNKEMPQPTYNQANYAQSNTMATNEIFEFPLNLSDPFTNQGVSGSFNVRAKNNNSIGTQGDKSFVRKYSGVKRKMDNNSQTQDDMPSMKKRKVDKNNSDNIKGQVCLLL